MHKQSGKLITRISIVLALFVVAVLIIADSHEIENEASDVPEETSADAETNVSVDEGTADAEETEVIDPRSFEAGEILAEAKCTGCHGMDGNTNMPLAGNLAGQNERYLYQQLVLIQSESRLIEEMVLNHSLFLPTDDPTDDDGWLPIDDDGLRALAKYYSLKQGRIGQADPAKDVELGEMIYRGGILEKEVAACTACHGPFGNGNLLAGFPRVSGQPVQYLEAQLKAYREEERTTDEEYGGMMRDIAKKLTDNEISAVANYMTGVYKP